WQGRAEYEQYRQEDPVQVVQEQVREPAQPQPEWDLSVLEQPLQHIWNVGDAPGPAFDLVVLAQMGGGVVPRLGRVAVERQIRRLHREPLAGSEKGLPVEAGVLRDHVLV